MRTLLKIAGGLLALVVLAIGVVVVLGANLPEQHSASVTVELDRPPAEVWGLVRDIEGQAKWRPGVTQVERLADREGQPVYRESNDFGRITYRIESEDPPRRLVMRIVDNEDFGGTWTYEVAARNGGSTLTITEDGEIDSPLFRFVVHYVTGYDATLNAYGDALKDALKEM